MYVVVVEIIFFKNLFYTFAIMQRMCSAIGCQNVYISGCGRTFHQFPSKNVLRKQLVTRITRADWYLTKDTIVCSDHFTADSFVDRVIPGFFSRRKVKHTMDWLTSAINTSPSSIAATVSTLLTVCARTALIIDREATRFNTLGLPFWCQCTKVVLKNRLLNKCYT